MARFRRTDDDEPGPDPPGSDDELSQEELERQQVEKLPDREAMSLLSPDVTIPADPSIAADVLSGDENGETAGED
jgi:hypothetical protein